MSTLAGPWALTQAKTPGVFEEPYFADALAVAGQRAAVMGFKLDSGALVCRAGYGKVPLGLLGFHREAPQGWACAEVGAGPQSAGPGTLGGRPPGVSRPCFEDKPACQGRRTLTFGPFSNLGDLAAPVFGRGVSTRPPWFIRRINDSVLAGAHLVEEKNARGFVDRYALHVFALKARKAAPGRYLEYTQMWNFHGIPKARWLHAGGGREALVIEAQQDEPAVDVLWVSFDATGGLDANGYDNFRIPKAHETTRIAVEDGLIVRRIEREVARKGEAFVFVNGIWARRELFERDRRERESYERDKQRLRGQ